MEDEGLVTRVGIKPSESKAGGRPSVLYELAPEPEKRLEILEGVRAFYAPGAELEERREPESKHYSIALQKIAELAKRAGPASEEQLDSALAIINKRLEYARFEERVGEKGTKAIQGHILFAEAQATNLRRDGWKDAASLLARARDAFVAGKAFDQVLAVDNYLHAQIMQTVAKVEELDESGKFLEAEEIIREDIYSIAPMFASVPFMSAVTKFAALCRRQIRQNIELQSKLQAPITITEIEDAINRALAKALKEQNLRVITMEALPILAEQIASTREESYFGGEALKVFSLEGISWEDLGEGPLGKKAAHAIATTSLNKHRSKRFTTDDA